MVHPLSAAFCVLQALGTLGVPLRIGTTFRASKRWPIFGNILLCDRHPSWSVLLLLSQRFVMWVMWKVVQFKILEAIAAGSFLHW